MFRRATGSQLRVWWKNAPTYAVDVMNPHYGDYYQHGMTPGDWLTPTPITFLTFAPLRWKFRFALLGPKKLIERADELANQLGNDDALAFVVHLLRKALESRGIGAKTNAGYGRFIPAG
ncbi:MAG: hypothetical protein Kow0069_37660 [Promethearchaeota archaeon]